MPLLWLGEDGKMTRCETGWPSSKAHFVIRLGEQQDAARGPVRRRVGCFRVLALRRQDAPQFVHREGIAELLQHAAAKLVLHAQLLKLAREERLVVSSIRHALRLRGKFHRRCERDAMPRADARRRET